MDVCSKCGRPVTNDEIGLTKKLINRGTKSFLCMDCLGSMFGCDREFLKKKIQMFRRMGCTLFPEEPGER